MKFMLMFVLFVTGCGYSSVDNELTGQAKKVIHQTPILCGDRADVDVSLGVMRNGVGSMSTQDVFLTVPHEADVKLLEDAAKTGKIVTVKYRVARVTFCWEDHIVDEARLAE